MTSRDQMPDDGPELLPPAELLRLRALLRRPPGAEVRSRHVAAIAMAARQRGNSPVGRFASRGARVAVAIVASLAITSGLAGAQLLPEPAQRLLSNVSERFAPTDADPPAEPAEPRGTAPVQTTDGERRPSDERGPDADATTTTTTDEGDAEELSTTDEGDAEADAETTTTSTPGPTITVPGPIGPGSPDDPPEPGPIDPGPTDPAPTTTVPPTTTTTVPPTTTTTTPPPTTSTTVLLPTDPPRPQSPPTGAPR